jgi:hypothetical protein
MLFNVEYTDTFGGESNYSWVRRAEIEVPDDASRALIMRRAKASVGITGCRGTRSGWGDGFEFRPYGICTVMFVIPVY